MSGHAGDQSRPEVATVTGPTDAGRDDVVRDVAGANPVEVLRRWERAGGVWRVTWQAPDLAVVALMRCDAGEVVEHVSSSAADWIAYLSRRPSSET
ncbi:MAG: hypothetical protein JWR42_2415 [Marmoricola sp.]|nr:hypothetical protein [Marmoricola sp.]